MLNLSEQHTKIVKDIAQSMGFHSCGIAEARRLDDDARRLEKWLNKGFHGEMKYMENHFDMRVDPTLLVPGAKSVITLLFNYFPDQEPASQLPKVAKYAYGKDYHLVIREKLTDFLKRIREKIGQIEQVFKSILEIPEIELAVGTGNFLPGAKIKLDHVGLMNYFDDTNLMQKQVGLCPLCYHILVLKF